MNASHDTIARFKKASTELREDRARLREAAINAMDLLTRFTDELKDLRSTADYVDPITQEPLVEFNTVDIHERGASLSVSALSGKYSASLEIHYAYGQNLVSGVKIGDDENEERRNNFYRDVFRGMPLRLQRDESATTLVRRIPKGGGLAEEAMNAGTWLCCFVEAVLKKERFPN